MIGPQIPPMLIGAALLALVGGARIGRDAILDTINPVANAAVAGPGPGGVPALAPAAVPPPAPAPAMTPAAVPVATAPHLAQREADGLFYVHALVNGHPIRFLIDTGASVVVLTAADARQAGIGVHEARFDRSVETVGGSAPMAWATLDRVDLAGHEVRGLKAAVVRNGLGVSLLGQNMLARLDSVTITSDRVSLR